MRQIVAVWVTTGLTAFVLGTGGLLSRELVGQPEVLLPVDVSAALVPDSTTIETLLARDAEYRVRLIEANETIAQADAAIALLQAEQVALVSENEILLAREADYQQTIEQANTMLSQLSTTASTQMAMAVAPESSLAAAPAPLADDHEEHEGHEESDSERDHEESDDD